VRPFLSLLSGLLKLLLSYGEIGIRVIHNTFNRLLQCSTDAALPLTPPQFLALVLTPEAGVQLIQEDLSIDREEAINVMPESSSYGTQMFPDNE
jgi:hypothetical protein